MVFASPEGPMKLHLGCGQNYLEGYLNVDFPLDKHSVQKKTVADMHADITQLRYPAGSIAEVRLHHVFEHFRRPVAAALLATWNRWLVEGGKVRIEVPDLGRSCWFLLNPFSSSRQKALTERHLFGSHEAPWAAHFEGYSAASLKKMVCLFGFRPQRVLYGSWRGIHNVQIVAVKERDLGSPEDWRKSARAYLENFLVDSSEGERSLLDTWLSMFDEQMSRGQEG